jgi:hypothetical protein
MGERAHNRTSTPRVRNCTAKPLRCLVLILSIQKTQHKFARRIAAPKAPAEGNGLPKIPHNVYDCIELCGDDLRAALLLFKMIFFCRNSTLTIEGKSWYVRGREIAVSPNRKC